MRDSHEAEHPAEPPQAFFAGGQAQGNEETPGASSGVHEQAAKRERRKANYRGHPYFAAGATISGRADREFNRMDSYVVTSLRRWQHRRGGQRATKRPSFTGQQLYGMGLHRLMGTVCYPTQATPRRGSDG